MSEAGPLLAVDRVSVHFGGLVALDAVSTSVNHSSVLGVIGPNGAGKTTLFNVLCGFIQPSGGSLRWTGAPLVGHAPHELAGLGIARTLQGLGLFPHLTAIENVVVGAARHSRAGFFAALLGLPRADRDERALRDRAREVMDRLGVVDVGQRLPGQLPYGVQKRIALARALVSEPQLLLLDEPASGLSHDELQELSGLILSLRDEMSVMLVEHHMDLVMAVCDSIVVLDFGKVIAAGTPAEVRAHPSVIEAYLGEEARPPEAGHAERG